MIACRSLSIDHRRYLYTCIIACKYGIVRSIQVVRVCEYGILFFFFTKKRIGRERNNAVYKFRDIASFTWRLRRSAYHFYDHRVYMYGILKVHFCQRRWNRHAERSSSFCRFFFNSFRILLYNTTNKHRTRNCQPITLVSKRWKNSIEYTERRVVIIGWNAEMFGLRRKLIRINMWHYRTYVFVYVAFGAGYGRTGTY